MRAAKEDGSMKRGVSLLCFLIAGSCLAAFAADTWDYIAYQRVMEQSGRTTDLGARTFEQIQARKPAYLQIIKDYLQRLTGYVDPAVLRAFMEVPREYFTYNY
jgi:protein-L-isoaspartate(D-aspartate) O-methyltransferase